MIDYIILFLVTYQQVLWEYISVTHYCVYESPKQKYPVVITFIRFFRTSQTLK